MGYHQAGFEVVGVDIVPQPNYPHEFYQYDALNLPESFDLSTFDAIHASPPCQEFSDLKSLTKNAYVNLIPEARALLLASGLPYIIENVERSPLIDPITLCGTMFPPLRVIRHRIFETNWPLEQPKHPPPPHPRVFTHDKRKKHYGKLDQNTSFIQVTGGGNSTIENKRDAMGIDWMHRREELNEAVPPAYTRYIGEKLREHLEDS